MKMMHEEVPLRSWRPLSERQEELLKFIDLLSSRRKYTLVVSFDGDEPWKIECLCEGDLEALRKRA